MSEYVLVPDDGETAREPVVVATDDPPGTAAPLSEILHDEAYLHVHESVDCSGGTTVVGLALNFGQFGATAVTVVLTLSPLTASVNVTVYEPGAL